MVSCSRGSKADTLQTVLKTLDAANSRLESTMDVLRSTMVEAAFRPSSEDPRSLLDFVDEEGVETMRDALKDSIRESRVCLETLFFCDRSNNIRKPKHLSILQFSPSTMICEPSKLP